MSITFQAGIPSSLKLSQNKRSSQGKSKECSHRYIALSLPLMLNSVSMSLLPRLTFPSVQPGSQFLSQVLSRAQLSSRLKSRSGSSSTLLSCVSDLLKMASLDANMAGSARAAAIFLQCQLLMNKVWFCETLYQILARKGPVNLGGGGRTCFFSQVSWKTVLAK